MKKTTHIRRKGHNLLVVSRERKRKKGEILCIVAQPNEGGSKVHDGGGRNGFLSKGRKGKERKELFDFQGRGSLIVPSPPSTEGRRPLHLWGKKKKKKKARPCQYKGVDRLLSRLPVSRRERGRKKKKPCLSTNLIRG